MDVQERLRLGRDALQDNVLPSKEEAIFLYDLIQDLQEENEQIKGAYKDREDDFDHLLKMLREIDTHIRSDKFPVPYIIETLKSCLPEYQNEFY